MRNNNDIYDKEWAQTEWRDKPWVNEWADIIMKYLKPKSVIDFGCGSGDILAPFEKKGLEVLGIDASTAVQDYLKIKKENFLSFDLREEFYPDKKYDLAIAVEVGEHIEKEYDEMFMDNLCRASNRVLWTADIGKPSRYHPNPQYPNYWMVKFFRRGFREDKGMTDSLKLATGKIKDIKDKYIDRLVLYRKIK